MRGFVTFDPDELYSSAIPPHQLAAAETPTRPTGDLLSQQIPRASRNGKTRR